MTREEAIAYAERVIGLGLNDETQAFCELAIKALEHPEENVVKVIPCGDCISRADAEAIFRNARKALMEQDRKEPIKDFNTRDLMLLNAEQMIHLLPSVTQKSGWIPVSERLPEELEAVNITWVNHNPEGYYANIKDKPFTATGVYFNGQWYWWSTMCSDIIAEYSHNYDDIIDDAIEIVAWMPLPEPYKEAKNG
mgnify:FL=1